MKSRFFNIFIILLIAQILLCNFGNFSQSIDLYFLPVMIFMLPVKTKTVPSMLIAFLTGLAVDFFSDGMLGLRAAALLPVAICRFKIIGLVFGAGLLAREEDLSFRKAGIMRIVLSSLMVNTVFLLIFQILDNAGTLSFGAAALKFFLSLLTSTLLSIFIASIFDAKEVSRWR